MRALELRIPPAALLLLGLAAIWLLARVTPRLTMPDAVQNWVPGGLLVFGVFVAVAAIRQFRQADTTVNPTTPDKASRLVSGGIYRLTRNPMYLGMLCLQLAFVIRLGSPAGLVPVAVFVAWMTRFQIIPEERVLLDTFGEEYADFCRRTRRWI